MFCKYCGAYVDSDAIFCSKCGKHVSDGFSATPKGFTLSIFRESQTFLLNPPIDILIDGEKRLSISNGGSVELDLPTGAHTIEFSQSMRRRSVLIDLFRDMQIIVKWNRITGGIEASVE